MRELKAKEKKMSHVGTGAGRGQVRAGVEKAAGPCLRLWLWSQGRGENREGDGMRGEVQRKRGAKLGPWRMSRSWVGRCSLRRLWAWMGSHCSKRTEVT